MKTRNFNDYEDFSIEILNRLNDDCGDCMDIAIIAKYNEAKEIVKSLLSLGLDLRSVEIYDEERDGYYNEYIISVCNIEAEAEIYCEPMLRESGYLNDDSDFIYVLDNCSSKVLCHLNSKHIYEVRIGECDELCDCENCEYNEPSSASNTTYKVNGKKVDENTYLKELKRFKDRHVDEMNKFRKLFLWQ